MTLRGWIVGIGLIASAAHAAPETRIHWVMGTYLRVTTDAGGAAATQACFEDARRFERLFSRFDDESELAHVHRERVHVPSREFAQLLARSLELTHHTGGTFDVTVGALTALWRDDPDPPAGAIAAARGTLGGVVQEGNALRLSSGTRLDFDGIAKGYAVDACVARLRTAGVAHAFVSFGESSLYALGDAPDGRSWDVAVRGLDPETAIGVLHLRDAAVSVSATRGAHGRRGIVDPRTGRVLMDDRVAVVIAPSATDAEAYSKAVLVWGRVGLARVEHITGVGAAWGSDARFEVGARLRRLQALETFASPRPLGRVEEGLS